MEAVRQRAELVLLAGGVILSVALSRFVLHFPADSLPQVPCENVLTLVLGDARQQLSQVMFDKVDEYFHGGVRGVVCEEGLGQDEPGAERGEEHEHGHHPVPARAVAGPWSWVNARVHVQEDRHMSNDKAVELLPWIWASCRASPKNIQAFTTGAYVLSRMVGRPDEGVRLLEEGIRKNPQSAELDFSLGELYLNRLKDPVRAEAHILSALQKNAPAPGKAGEEARDLRLRIFFYLGYLAKNRGDAGQLRECLKGAEATDPAHVTVENLRAMLKSLETKE